MLKRLRFVLIPLAVCIVIDLLKTRICLGNRIETKFLKVEVSHGPSEVILFFFFFFYPLVQKIFHFPLSVFTYKSLFQPGWGRPSVDNLEIGLGLAPVRDEFKHYSQTIRWPMHVWHKMY